MSGAITQSGPVAAGHLPVFVANGIQQDSGSASGGLATELGITNAGSLALGINSAGTTDPFSQFGITVSEGTITLGANSYNGAPAVTVYWDLNGVLYPLNPAGAGNITGPGTSVVGDLVSFNSTNGEIVKDSGISQNNIVQTTGGGTISAALLPIVEAATVADGMALLANSPGLPGVFTDTQMNYYAQFLVGGINPTVAFQSQQQGQNSTPAVTAGISIPGTSTVHEGTALFACVENYSTTTEGVSGTFFSVASAANTAGSFGINVLVNDNGFVTDAVVGCEWDIGAGNVSTWAVGNNMIGVFPNGTPTRATAYQVSANSVEESVANPWQVGFATAEGAAIVGFAAGPLLNGTASASQPMTFYSIGTDGTINGVNLQSVAFADGVINLVAQTGEGGFVNTGSLVQEGGALFGDGIAVFPASGAGTLLAQFTVYTAQHITTTSGDTPTGSTSMVVASASGIAMGQSVGSPSPAIASGTTVSSVSGTTVHISAATLADIPSGTAVEFSTNAAVGSVTTNGSATAYNTSSDYRLKDTFEFSAGDILDGIPVYEGRFKGEAGPTRPMVLAHEVQAVAPFAVSGDKDAISQGGAIIPQMVDYGALVPALIAKAQSHGARLAALEARLAELDGRRA